jgi:hypothetical protein
MARLGLAADWTRPSLERNAIADCWRVFRVPIDRHADGQLTEVLRKIVLVMPFRRPCCSRA